MQDFSDMNVKKRKAYHGKRNKLTPQTRSAKAQSAYSLFTSVKFDWLGE